MEGERGQERRKERGGEGKGWEAATQEKKEAIPCRPRD